MKAPHSSGKTGRSSGSVRTQGMRALAAGSALLHGQAKAATTLFLEIPGKVGLQASWQTSSGSASSKGAGPTGPPPP